MIQSSISNYTRLIDSLTLTSFPSKQQEGGAAYPGESSTKHYQPSSLQMLQPSGSSGPPFEAKLQKKLLDLEKKLSQL